MDEYIGRQEHEEFRRRMEDGISGSITGWVIWKRRSGRSGSLRPV